MPIDITDTMEALDSADKLYDKGLAMTRTVAGSLYRMLSAEVREHLARLRDLED